MTTAIHGVNHLDLKKIEGVYFWKIQVLMAQSIQDADHVWLVMIKAMRALTRYAVAGIEGTGSATRISAFWKSCYIKVHCLSIRSARSSI